MIIRTPRRSQTLGDARNGFIKALHTHHARRNRPGAAAAAYSHTIAIVHEPAIAEEITTTALRRGAHSRLAVLAHARYLALSSVAGLPPLAPATEAETSLLNLAVQLGQARPSIERAVVDLELRYALDTASFARVLGVSSERAASRARSVTSAWAEQLDPAMMAWLGPGSCSDLAEILTTAQVWPRAPESSVISSVDTSGPIPLLQTGTDGKLLEPAPSAQTHMLSRFNQGALKSSDKDPGVAADTHFSTITIGSLMAAAAPVHEHARNCDICGERLRLLTPVRSMVGQLPIEPVPPSVAAAARAARRRLPSALPPSIEPRRIDAARLRTPMLAIAVIAATVAAVAVTVRSMVGSDDKPTQADRVAKLVQAAPPSDLLGTPSIITPGVKTASLANNGNHPITWTAATSAPWLTVQPQNGRLQASQSISIAVLASPPASGPVDATITIAGNDGSRQVLRYDPDGG